MFQSLRAILSARRFTIFLSTLLFVVSGANVSTVLAKETALAEETSLTDERALKPDEKGMRRIVQPFLKRYCVDCHGPDLQEGDFRTDVDLQNNFTDLRTKEIWSEVVDVLNSHEMPPEDERQPKAKQTAKVVDWITEQMARAELLRRDSRIVLRRLNRKEYRNTIYDLLGIEIDTSHFPDDPLAGGFDNNGRTLTLSPLLLELYYDTARKSLDHALTHGEEPPVLKWRFQPESGDSDSNRVKIEGQNIIVNGGKDPVDGQFKVMHHQNWDRKINIRNFAVPHAGNYAIRIHAASNIPTREDVLRTGTEFLQQRMDKQLQKHPKAAKWHREAFEQGVEHLKTDRMYDYGPGRLKLTQHLGGQPLVLSEFDIDAPADTPKTYETVARFTSKKAGITYEYAYQIPPVFDNGWFQKSDNFARPEVRVDWIELEGPINPVWPPASFHQILYKSPLLQQDPAAYAKEVLKRFMTKAYRRPVTTEEVKVKHDIYLAAQQAGDPLVEAIRPALTAVLVSPHFLYLVEPTFSKDHSSETHRVLTDQSGKQIRAQVLATGEGNVTIKREDGREFQLPIKRLSEEDQEFLNSFFDSKEINASSALNQYQLASRLSYFLWKTMPDDILFQLAEERKLDSAEELAKQVDRMLADPRSERLVDDFATLWMGLREVGANPPAVERFPRYDRHLETSIVQESIQFFGEILHNDLPLSNLIRSDFVVINERLARFYGIDGVQGDQFRRVALPKKRKNAIPRGGVVTQASMLSITSNGTRTSPVKRGTWVMKNLLGIDPGLPVANAGDIAPKVPGIDKATVRERLEVHRSLPQCARCHDKIDPLGFALENFDASGAWREREAFGYKGSVDKDDPLIDASGKLPDGTFLDGIFDLQKVLLKKKHLFYQCITNKMMTYALGRQLGVADRIHEKAAVVDLKRNGQTVRQLIKFIVTSKPFRSR